MEVIKRSGHIEQFDISKIRNVINTCASKLNGDYSEYTNVIESKLFVSNVESITTENIQKLLIQTTINILQETQNKAYGKLASQFILYNIEKNFKKKFNMLGVTHIKLQTFIECLVQNGDYNKQLIGKWSQSEMEQLENILDYSYDDEILVHQIMLLSKKYLLKDKDENVYELPQIANIVQAMSICKDVQGNRIEMVKQVYEALASNKISLATPIKSNLRRNNNFTSCYIIEVEDDSISILEAIKKCAIFSKNGGGVGIYLGKLRPSLSYIKGVRNANNIVKWVKIFDTIAPAWNQNGVRNGAFTISLDVFHKDILSFIECKTESGGDANEKCFNIFPQVIINKQFINEVLNDGMFPLLDRYIIQQTLKIDVCNLDDYNKNYDKIKEMVKEGKIENCLLVKAKDVWRKLLQVYVETGELYIIHKDNINKTNPLVGNGNFINSANLCIESYTPINETMNHSCNLISLNLNKIEINDFKHYCSLSVIILNELLKNSNKIFPENINNIENINPIGIGLMGVSDYMSKNGFSYINDKIEIEKLCEQLSYYSLEASMEYAKVSGNKPKLYEVSSLANGKFLGKTGNELNQQSKCGLDWVKLLNEVMKYGCSNLFLTAIAPNTSTSVLCNASSSFIPVYNKAWYETYNDISLYVQSNYADCCETADEVNTTHIVELTNAMCKWIDAGISMELTLNENTNIKQLSDCLLSCFQDNLKGMYYCRTSNKKSKFTCVGCEN